MFWCGVVGCEIEGESVFFEFDFCCVFDDFFEEERCDDGGWCLVKVMFVFRMLVWRYVMIFGYVCKVGIYLIVERIFLFFVEVLFFLLLLINKCLFFVLYFLIFRN